MFRVFFLACALACLSASVWAQGQQMAAPTIRTVTKKPSTAKIKSAPKPELSDNGPCRIGVITAVGDSFSVDKFGVTVFETEHSEVVTNWGIDDLIFARVRSAAGPGLPLRRITYPSQAFEPYYHPTARLFPDPRESLSTIVQGITSNAGCERYLVVTKFAGQLPGTNLHVDGVGVYNRGLGRLIRHTALFANVSLTLLDGQTYAKQQRMGTDFGARLEQSLRLTENPLVKLDNEFYPEPASTAVASSVLRERTRALVAATVDRLLPGYLKEE